MVIIEFTDEQKLIKKMIVDFCDKKLTREVLKQIDETGNFPEEIINEMSKLGLFALKAPKEYGGVGVDTLTYVLAIEEMSKYSAVASIYIATPNSLSTGPLLMDGTDEQKQKYIKEIASGEKKLSFALTESQAGSDAGGVTSFKFENYKKLVYEDKRLYHDVQIGEKFYLVFVKGEKEPIKVYNTKNSVINDI